MQAAKILVVDDDAVARELLAEALKKEGYDVEAFGSGEAAIARGREGRVDLVLTDIRMGAVDGLTVLREFKRMSQDTAIVVLTAFGSLEGAIEAIKQGAYDYLAKPFKKEEIKLVVQRSLDHCRLLRENTKFREELKSKDEWSPLVGSSPAMLEVYKLVARVSESKSTVLLQGESGTGKELIARAIHGNSPRRDKPFVPVNCGALPDTLLESEMFGYEKGAFTGAVGTKTACSSRPAAARCFSTRLASSDRLCKSSCCASCRIMRFAVWVGHIPSKWTCGSLPRPIGTWNSSLRKGNFATTCFIA